MTSVLISFLGRVPREEDGYRKTTYRFEDKTSTKMAFFGWALKDRVKPDKMVILGTSGSMNTKR